jgi:Helix-turn-helix domain
LLLSPSKNTVDKKEKSDEIVKQQVEFYTLLLFECELIRARTTEGRVQAMAAGVRMGRRPKLTPTQRQHAKELREAGKSLQEIGDVLGVSHMTVWRVTDHQLTPAGMSHPTTTPTVRNG